MIKTMKAFILTCGTFFILLAPLSAPACSSCIVEVGGKSAVLWWPSTVTTINTYITQSFYKHQEWLETTFWDGLVLPGLHGMSDELTAVSVHQAFIIGTFFDAKHQLETQQTLQAIKARAHKDYHPSTGMCQFGSVSKSLAASERKAEFNALVLRQRSQDRNLGAPGTPGSAGSDLDKLSRIKQFKEVYCDPADNNNGLRFMCKGSEADPNRMNNDINYAGTIGSKWTLDVDFSDTKKTDDEEDVFALAANLFAHDIVRPPSRALDGQEGIDVTAKQRDYMKLRSLLAKRSVAENNFNEIVSMKASGLPGAQDYMVSALSELGVADSGVLDLIGKNPSYYAQMEVLTKKLYQNPSFYTNLYDKPANVARKEVAMQAIGLMQKFDLFKSHLRNETSIAVLLELQVQKLQDRAEVGKAGSGTSGTVGVE